MKTYNSDGQPTPGYDLSKLRLKKPGDGHNDSLITAAIAAYKMGAPKEATVGRLRELYEPSRPDYETAPQRAVDRAWEANGDISKLVDGKPRGKASGPSKVTLGKFDPTKLERFERMTMTELLAKSPGDVKTEPLEIIKALFSEKDLVCAETADQKYEGHAIWEVGKLQEEIKKSKFEIDDFKFLNPSTFLEKAGITQKGKSYLSKRCNDDVAQRCYMLLECDVKEGGEREGGKGLYTKEEALAIRERFITFCMELAKYLPLAMVVDSGGKSIHFWFWCGEWTEEVERVFAIACAHGADKAMRVLSQKARMPNVSGYDDRRDQKLLYYDPERIGGDWDMVGFMAELRGEQIYNTDLLRNPNEWHHVNGKFLRRDSYGNWMPETVDGAKLSLKGVFPPVESRMELIETLLREVKDVRTIGGYGTLAGHRKGIVEMQGGKFLVTTEAKFLTPVKGGFPLIDKILGNAFQDAKTHFLSYLKIATLGIYESNGTMAIPAAAFCGEPSSYKSFLQEHILTPLWGSRSADPAMAMNGQTAFNSELIKAEHVFFGDLSGDGDQRKRQKIGAYIKQQVANGLKTCHPKGLEASTVSICQALTISTNLERHNLTTLPTLDDTIDGKLLIYLMHKGEPVAPTDTPERRAAFRADVHAELPAFLYYLLNEFEIPEEFKCNRFMIKGHIDLALENLLFDLTKGAEMMPVFWKKIEADDDFFRKGKCVFTAQEILDLCENYDICKTPQDVAEILKDAQRLPNSGVKFLGNVSRLKNGKKVKARWWQFNRLPSNPAVDATAVFDDVREDPF